MYDGMQYDLIQSQVQGHELFKVRNLAIFNSYLHCLLKWELTTDVTIVFLDPNFL